MLLIRPEQMLAFEQERRHRFESKLASHLQHILSSAGIPFDPDGLPAQIRAGANEAKIYGFASEADVAVFVEITSLYLGGFPHAGFPKQALANLLAYGLDPAVKLKRYRDWARITTLV
jgi:hypothetical protein